jgi:hypothetical protein
MKHRIQIYNLNFSGCVFSSRFSDKTSCLWVLELWCVISLSARVKVITPKVGYRASLMIIVCVTRSKLALRIGEATILRIAFLSCMDRLSWHPNFKLSIFITLVVLCFDVYTFDPSIWFFLLFSCRIYKIFYVEDKLPYHISCQNIIQMSLLRR